MNTFRWRGAGVRLASGVTLFLCMAGCAAAQGGPEGTAARSSPTRGSHDILTAEEIRRHPPVATVEELLERHFGVVYVRRDHRTPGSPGQVYMLGLSGPLFVVDGVPVDHGGSLGLNPQDIQSIELVKHGAGALYGLRGASGAILITTRTR
jgi:TonB-dependent starch-binding outer membrane protein SusC